MNIFDLHYWDIILLFLFRILIYTKLYHSKRECKIKYELLLSICFLEKLEQ